MDTGKEADEVTPVGDIRIVDHSDLESVSSHADPPPARSFAVEPEPSAGHPLMDPIPRATGGMNALGMSTSLGATMMSHADPGQVNRVRELKL